MAETTLSVGERYDATRPRLLAMLDEMARAGRVEATVYVEPGAGPPDAFAAAGDVREAVRALGNPDTGAAVFCEPDSITAVAPPFPIGLPNRRSREGRPLHNRRSREGGNPGVGGGATVSAGLDPGPLAALLARRLRVAVVMIRLGRYAVGVLDGDALVASKTDTRYVKSRHRAGGSSQRRFERSRERLVRELYDKTCAVASDVLRPFADSLDYVLLGGEKQTVGGLLRRCETLRRLEPITLQRRLNVRKPGQAALEGVHAEVWSSRVVVMDRAGS